MKKNWLNLYLLIPIAVVYLGISIAGNFAEKKIRFQSLRVPPFLMSQPIVEEGNIVTETALGQKKILINHLDLTNNNGLLITNLSVSPDRQKICFEAQAGKKYYLYWSHWNAENITLISEGSDCRWSADSLKIAYLSFTGQKLAPKNVSCYWVDSGLNLNLTDRMRETARVYKTPIWSTNNVDIFTQYDELNQNGTTILSGIAVINISSRTITDK